MREKQPPGSLDGIRVIDLTRVLGGPFCTQILGDHGADVIKIEPPAGDEVRDWGPPFKDGDASYFIGINRNKRSVGLDLSVPEGRDVLLRLLEGADVLVENFKPGTMEKWSLGYDGVLEDRFPGLIHCRITGFGADGPLGGHPGYDAIVQAMVGMFSVNGTPQSGPTRVGVPIIDIGTGLYAAIAILMALWERHRSGKGQFLDMTLYDCGIALMHPHMANHFLSGRVPGLTGNAHPNVSPYDKYRTGTLDVFLGTGNDRAFGRVCRALGKPELADDPQFRTNGDRVANRDALTGELENLLADRDGVEVVTCLTAAGVPAGPVLDVKQVAAHPHAAHRRAVVEDDDYKAIDSPIRMSRTRGGLRHKPPRFGEHGREVLAECGFDAAEIEDLVAAGALLEKKRRG